MASASSGVVILDVWRWKNTFIVCRGSSCFVLDCIATKRLGKSLRHSVRFNECLLYFRHRVSYIYKFIFLAQVFKFFWDGFSHSSSWSQILHVAKVDLELLLQRFSLKINHCIPFSWRLNLRWWVVCHGWSWRSNLGSSAIESILKIIALPSLWVVLSSTLLPASLCFSGWHLYSILYSKLWELSMFQAGGLLVFKELLVS